MEDLLNELELAEQNAQNAYREYLYARSRVEDLENSIIRRIAEKGRLPVPSPEPHSPQSGS